MYSLCSNIHPLPPHPCHTPCHSLPELPSTTEGGGAPAVKDTKVCESGAHTFTASAIEHPCRVCTLCGHCTGYGPTCISTKGTGDRVAGR